MMDRSSAECEVLFEEYENLCMVLLNVATMSQEEVTNYTNYDFPLTMVNDLNKVSRECLDSAVKGVAPENGCTRTVVYNNENFWKELQSVYPDTMLGSGHLTHELLCKHWLTICLCRNASAHPCEEGRTQDNLSTMKDALKELSEYGCFSVMHKLRDELLGVG